MTCRLGSRARQGADEAATRSDLAEWNHLGRMPLFFIEETAGAMLRALDEALDLVDFGLVLLDRDMRVRFVNAAFANLAAIPPETLNPDLRLRDLLDEASEAKVRMSADALSWFHSVKDRQLRVVCYPMTDGGRVLACTECRQPTERDTERAVQEEAERLSAELRFNKETLEDQASYLAGLAEESDANARRAEEAKRQLEQEIAERTRLEAELRRLATTDALTNALNRRRFFELAQHEMVHAREAGLEFGLLMVDIDHFKTINDRYGHPVGDAALRHLVGLLHKALRKVDLIGRLGGEEFAIVLSSSGTQQVLRVAERLRAVVAKTPLDAGAARVDMTISIGLAMASDTDHNVEQVVARADAQLYAAKNSGRNRVCHAELVSGGMDH